MKSLIYAFCLLWASVVAVAAGGLEPATLRERVPLDAAAYIRIPPLGLSERPQRHCAGTGPAKQGSPGQIQSLNRPWTTAFWNGPGQPPARVRCCCCGIWSPHWRESCFWLKIRPGQRHPRLIGGTQRQHRAFRPDSQQPGAAAATSHAPFGTTGGYQRPGIVRLDRLSAAVAPDS